MHIATVRLKSISQLSWSRHHGVPKIEREPTDKYELRTWLERFHYDNENHILIPAEAFKKCLANAARFLSESIPGRGKATYTKRFEAGIMVLEPMRLAQTRNEVKDECAFVPSDGRPGGGKRVLKHFPYIEAWEGTLKVHIFDPEITQEVFRRHLKAAGMFVGVGRFRPRQGGAYGRFEIVSVDWKEASD